MSTSVTGSYFIWTSHCTYWFPNDAVLLSSPALPPDPLGMQLWQRLGNPTHNDTSFSTQSTQVLAIPKSKPKSEPQQQRQKQDEQDEFEYIYIADRFEPYIAQNQTGRYVWLPLKVAAGGRVHVNWESEWVLGRDARPRPQ